MITPRIIDVNALLLEIKPDLELSEAFTVKYFPAEWLPLEVLTSLSVLGEGDPEAPGFTQEQTDALDGVFHQIVVDWNLQTVRGDPIPAPTEDNPGTWAKVPMIILNLMLEQMIQMQDLDVPSTSGNGSSGTSQPPVPRNREERRAAEKASRSGSK
jgi:hypothetical protein